MATNYGTFSYPGSLSSNPSIGTNGSVAPTSSTEIGFIDGSGNLQGASATNPLPVTAVVPGGVTANQGTPNTAANGWPVKITDGTNTTAVKAASTAPLATDPAAVVALSPNGNQATAALQGTGNTSLATIATNTTDASTAANQSTMITSLSNIQANQTNGTQTTQISGTVPLPTGAATSALQTTGNTSLASLVLSSADLYTTGAGPATAVINTNLLLAVTGTGSFDMLGYRSISFQINTGASTTAVAVNFEGSDDNVNFIAIGMYDKTTPTAAPVTTFTTAASTFRYFEGPIELRYFRVRLVAAITAGTVQCFSISRVVPYSATNLSLAAGTQSIGNIATVTTVTTVSAVTAITNALPAGTNVIGFTKQGGRAQSFVPVQNIYSTTNVTTSAYVQLVASTTTASTYLDIFDSSGQAMILATGASGSEVILAYIPPGGDQIAATIPISTRIAIKALTATANVGYILLNGWN